MKSRTLGKNISTVEATRIAKDGLFLQVGNDQYFLPYEEFPWFKTAKESSVLKVRLLNANHLRWPELDVDLELDCIRNPDKYPLMHSRD